MKYRLFILLFYLFSNINVSFSQDKAVRIVVPLNDSVYVWKGNPVHELWGFNTPDSSIVLDFDDDDRTINQIHTMCGRGNCPGGIEMNFYNNGIMESKGQYGFTTDVDSLKYEGGDGFLTYVDKVGDWYYWNDKGFLIRKEKWVKGKLAAITRFSTIALPNKKLGRKK